MKPFPENPKYLVSTSGRVYSVRTGQFLQPQINIKGYLRVALYDGGRRVWWFVHRIVAITFIRNPKNKKEVNHKNFNITDNRKANLNWMTSSENKLYNRNKYKFRTKFILKGRTWKYEPDPNIGF